MFEQIRPVKEETLGTEDKRSVGKRALEAVMLAGGPRFNQLKVRGLIRYAHRKGMDISHTASTQLDKKEPSIIVFNHPMGAIDGLSVAHTWRKPISFVYKNEFAENPLLRRVFRKLGALPVAHETMGSDTIEAIIEELRKGKTVAMSGYKGLSPLEHVPRPEEGPLYIAAKASEALGVDVPLQVAGIYGEHAHVRDESATPEARGASLKRSLFQPVHVHYGERVSSQGLSRSKRDPEKRQEWEAAMDTLHAGLAQAQDTAKSEWHKRHGKK